MDIKEFSLYDKDFNESMFLSFVNNVFVKVFTSIMMDKLDTVKHYMNESVYAYCSHILNEAKDIGARHMYDEMNVWDSKIESLDITDDYFVIKVFLRARYMEYMLDMESGNTICGNDQSRVVVPYLLTFKKRRDSYKRSIMPKCTYCGASIDIHNNGICPYCRGVYDTEKHDYVLSELKKM